MGDKKVPALQMQRPSRAAAEGQKRIVLEVPASKHGAVKAAAAKQGLSIKDFILRAIDQQL
jgi:uncharacterized protein (DUF1778 family)